MADHGPKPEGEGQVKAPGGANGDGSVAQNRMPGSRRTA